MRSILIYVTVFAIGYVKCQSDHVNSNIIGGHDAKPGDNPHMCSLYYEGRHQCGASIISDRWAVTAAHCVHHDATDTMQLRCGSILRSKPLHTYTVAKYIYHEKFSNDVYAYDIALLQIEGQFKLGTKDQDKIQLPQQDSDPEPTVIATTIGWGQIEVPLRPPGIPDILQTLDIPIVKRADCIVDYANFTEVIVDDTSVCTGGQGRESCQWDSGSPLRLNNTIVGIVSRGKPCAIVGFPTVYTRVGLFRDWIRTHSGV